MPASLTADIDLFDGEHDKSKAVPQCLAERRLP
jgi:hypothetical protein